MRLAINVDDTIIPTKPNQPLTDFQSPKRSFGKTKTMERSCQSSWFSRWPFLHYDEGKDTLFCHTCLLAYKSKKMKTTSQDDPAFVTSYIYLLYFIIGMYIMTMTIIIATPTSGPDQLETAYYGLAESLQQALEAALELESCQLASRKHPIQVRSAQLDCESAAEKD